jgi:polar amino acid transport system ATP-binding protein
MIQIRDVHKSFGSTEVLRGLTLTVEKGEVLVVIGPSGSGKSTLLQCINGLEPINRGSIRVDDVEVYARGTDLNKLRRKIGIVFQQFNVFPHLTALQNVALAPRVVLKLSRQEAAARAKAQLKRVGLSDKLDMRPSKLSGGQQQRLAIARALAMEPNYMLFDEVTSALDPELVGEVLDTLRMLSDEGMTMICVTHEMRFAREAADRIIFIDEGRVCEEGPPAQIFGQPREQRTKQFLRQVS